MAKALALIFALLIVALSAGCARISESGIKETDTAKDGASAEQPAAPGETEGIVMTNTDGLAIKIPDCGGDKLPTDTVIGEPGKIASPEGEITPTHTEIIRARWTESDRIYTGCVNAEIILALSSRHLPVFRVASDKELLDLNASFGDLLPELSKLSESLSPDFFKDNVLAVIYLTASSGSFRYGVKKVVPNGAGVDVVIETTNAPEVFTCDMAGWLIAVGLSKQDVSGDVTLDAYLEGDGRLEPVPIYPERPVETDIVPFSFKTVKQSTAPEGWHSDSVKTDGFVNTTPAAFSSPAERAKAEVTLPYNMIQVFYDSAEDIYGVHFFSVKSPGETVYMNGNGVTVLIIFDE